MNCAYGIHEGLLILLLKFNIFLEAKTSILQEYLPVAFSIRTNSFNKSFFVAANL
jgi:hypothetical protein